MDVDQRVPGPVRAGEELRLAEARVVVQHDRRTLGGVGVLVEVHGDAGDTRHVQLEGRNVVSKAAEVGQQEAADAGVHVERHLLLQRDAPELLDGIDHAVGVGGRGADDQDRLIRDRLRHRLGDGAERLGIHVHQHDLEIQVVRRLVECRVGGDGNDDLGLLDLRVQLARAIPRGFDRQDDALGATAGEGAHGVLVAAQVVRRHAHELVFEPHQAGVHRRIQRIFAEKAHVGFLAHALCFASGVEDVGEGSPATPVDVVLPVGGKLGKDALARRPRLGNLHDACSSSCAPGAGRAKTIFQRLKRELRSLHQVAASATLEPVP